MKAKKKPMTGGTFIKRLKSLKVIVTTMLEKDYLNKEVQLGKIKVTTLEQDRI